MSMAMGVVFIYQQITWLIWTCINTETSTSQKCVYAGLRSNSYFSTIFNRFIGKTSTNDHFDFFEVVEFTLVLLLLLNENTLESLFHVEDCLFWVLLVRDGALCWYLGFCAGLSTQTSLSVKKRKRKGYTNKSISTMTIVRSQRL